jgi:hypothetical protein
VILDVSSVIASLATPCIQVLRRGPGQLVAGYYTPGNPVELTITAHVQRGAEAAELLPAGERTTEAIAIYTSDRLYPVSAPDQGVADLVRYAGNTYEVQAVEDWSAIGNFYRAVAVKVIHAGD